MDGIAKSADFETMIAERDKTMDKNKASFSDYLEMRYKKIILVFVCMISFVMIMALASPLENKEFVMVVALFMFCLSGVGIIAYTWADFIEWKKGKNNAIALGSNIDEILSGRFEEHVNKLANYQYLTEEQKKLYKNDFYQKHSALMNGKTVYPIETQKEMIEIREILDGRNP